MGKKYHHKDNSYGKLQADYAELYYCSKVWKEAQDLFKEAKVIFRNNVQRFLYEFNFHNINAINNPLKVCADLHENKHDIEQKLGSERIDKGGKVGMIFLILKNLKFQEKELMLRQKNLKNPKEKTPNLMVQ